MNRLLLIYWLCEHLHHLVDLVFFVSGTRGDDAQGKLEGSITLSRIQASNCNGRFLHSGELYVKHVSGHVVHMTLVIGEHVLVLVYYGV